MCEESGIVFVSVESIAILLFEWVCHVRGTMPTYVTKGFISHHYDGIVGFLSFEYNKYWIDLHTFDGPANYDTLLFDTAHSCCFMFWRAIWRFPKTFFFFFLMKF